ncbi:MAG: hypothetical protein K2J79_10015 [Ruminiclostridium sp.]|nr:hypothetical protein [Ruminiclostridium sp.]
MKKITIILLILLVIGILAGVLVLAYSSGELTYVCDYKETKFSAYASSMVAKRLYSSGIDEKKMDELSQSLLTTSFTEEELLEATLKSGKPEFYPWFSFELKKKPEENTLFLEGKFGQTLFDDQKTSRFTITDLQMEMTCENISINSEGIIMFGAEDKIGADVEKVTPLLAEDGSGLAARVGRSGGYNITLEGGSGTVMVQYKYAIRPTDGLFNHTVLEDQLIQIYITVNTAADGSITADYEIIEASQVSDLY